MIACVALQILLVMKLRFVQHSCPSQKEEKYSFHGVKSEQNRKRLLEYAVLSMIYPARPFRDFCLISFCFVAKLDLKRLSIEENSKVVAFIDIKNILANIEMKMLNIISSFLEVKSLSDVISPAPSG